MKLRKLLTDVVWVIEKVYHGPIHMYGGTKNRAVILHQKRRAIFFVDKAQLKTIPNDCDRNQQERSLHRQSKLNW